MKGDCGGWPPRVFRISFDYTTFHHYLGAWNRLCLEGNLLQPIWVVTRHKYGISARISSADVISRGKLQYGLMMANR